MSKPVRSSLLIALLLGAPAVVQAQVAPATPAASGVTLDLRLRHEAVDDAAFAEDAAATTLRARIGYRMLFSPTWSALVEAELTGHLGGDDFNSSRNGRSAYPAVTDPDNHELNQAVLNYTPAAGTRLSLGRQRLVYANQRFIGNVGWRQNEATFDAIDGQYAFASGVGLRYSYLDRVTRIFGDLHENRDLARWDLDAHVLEANYAIGPGQLAGYAHLYENRSLPLSSHRNLGLRYSAQGGPADGLGWLLNAEFAQQRPYANGARRNEAEYHWLEGGLRWQGHQFSLGVEQLGGDGRYGLQTPLATMHAFNGWADRFLVTPVDGLQDRYLGWKRGFGAVTANVVLHDYRADKGGADYGSELDASLAWALRPQWTALVKLARYDSDGFAADVDKLWLSIEYRR